MDGLVAVSGCMQAQGDPRRTSPPTGDFPGVKGGRLTCPMLTDDSAGGLSSSAADRWGWGVALSLLSRLEIPTPHGLRRLGLCIVERVYHVLHCAAARWARYGPSCKAPPAGVPSWSVGKVWSGLPPRTRRTRLLRPLTARCRCSSAPRRVPRPSGQCALWCSAALVAVPIGRTPVARSAAGLGVQSRMETPKSIRGEVSGELVRGHRSHDARGLA